MRRTTKRQSLHIKSRICLVTSRISLEQEILFSGFLFFLFSVFLRGVRFLLEANFKDPIRVVYIQNPKCVHSNYQRSPEKEGVQILARGAVFPLENHLLPAALSF